MTTTRDRMVNDPGNDIRYGFEYLLLRYEHLLLELRLFEINSMH